MKRQSASIVALPITIVSSYVRRERGDGRRHVILGVGLLFEGAVVPGRKFRDRSQRGELLKQRPVYRAFSEQISVRSAGGSLMLRLSTSMESVQKLWLASAPENWH